MESKAARPFSNASAFLTASTDSTAQRFGTFSARCLHLFVWRAPMKCQFIVAGRLAAFSRSSVVLNNPSTLTFMTTASTWHGRKDIIPWE